MDAVAAWPSGDVVVTLLPAQLLANVLEPLASALAARSRFSLERFSDVYLLTRDGRRARPLHGLQQARSASP